MTFCPHCDFMNSDQDVYCASCGKRLKNQSVEIEQTAPTHPPPSNVERNVIVGCCVLSILLFFSTADDSRSYCRRAKRERL